MKVVSHQYVHHLKCLGLYAESCTEWLSEVSWMKLVICHSPVDLTIYTYIVKSLIQAIIRESI